VVVVVVVVVLLFCGCCCCVVEVCADPEAPEPWLVGTVSFGHAAVQAAMVSKKVCLIGAFLSGHPITALQIPIITEKPRF